MKSKHKFCPPGFRLRLFPRTRCSVPVAVGFPAKGLTLLAPPRGEVFQIDELEDPFENKSG